MHGDFKKQTDEIPQKNTWTWLPKGHTKRETESFQIAAQNSAIRTSYLKAKIGNAKLNSECR